MKSIPQIAEELNISTSTIREYLKNFSEFFSGPVENDGVKEYPNETSPLIAKIYDYYQTSGMTKEEIREKLAGDISKEEAEEQKGGNMGSAGSIVQMEDAGALGEKIDHLTTAIEKLTAVLLGNKNTLNLSGFDEIEEINLKLSEIIEITKESDPEKIEKHVKEADGTLIFSYGKLTINAEKALKFARSYKKPMLHVNFETEKNPDKAVRSWLEKLDIKTLHVAGRNVSKIPQFKKAVDNILASIVNK